MADDVLTLFNRALADFAAKVDAIRPDQWSLPTPCTEWDVRALVNHLTYEQSWAVPLLAGRSLAEVGDRYDGDLLGADPVGSWTAAAAASAAAFNAPGALARTVQLSYGDTPASSYCGEMTLDLAVHGWDLARAIGADETMDPEIVTLCTVHLEPIVDQWQGAGIFADRIDQPGTDPQTRLLGMTGRKV
jgi:uncharacterized protein (TIGR03086 family)